ncbi:MULTISPECIES: amino acid ABC transporter substrate-binding protein [Halorussus]|uniref:amino acid ABC transporter substrate-binding protein n=1 Tax=Halorussus TaxID=1070314 RepID=UPI00209D760C|nr:amino acid ABC transporter substrate-binding protein [Halorussus vallis]USZ78021.1 amino acid ABC transporter substrate-binding protein [Halorussus vallis]
MRTDTSRRQYLRATGAAGVTVLTGIGGAAAQNQTITLGGSMSLSGDNADLGQLYRDSYRLTIRRINEAGGVKAGDGNTYRLEMILRDDESDASTSRAIYQELIDRQGVNYLLGPYSSTVTLPASAVAAQNQKPMVEGGGASPEIFSQGNEWIFGLLPTADKYPLSSIDMAMAQDQPPKAAALLAESDTFSQSSAKGARQKLKQAGVNVAVDQTFPSETSDLSTILGQVRSSPADILILAAHQKHAVILAKQMEAQNVDVDMAMATVGSLTASFKQQTGENGDYMYGPSSWAINADFQDSVFGSTSGFVDAIQSEYGYQPDYHNAAGAAVIETFQRAFQQVQNLTPTNVRNAIRDIQFPSAYGDISFGQNGVISKNMLVYQWQPPQAGGATQTGDGNATAAGNGTATQTGNGTATRGGGAGGSSRKTIVWPEQVQQRPPIYPMPDWSRR